MWHEVSLLLNSHDEIYFLQTSIIPCTKSGALCKVVLFKCFYFLLKLRLCLHTDLEKEKVEEATNAESSLLTKVSRGFEIDALSKSQVAQVEIEDACSITKDLSSPDQNGERVKILTAEVESLKVMILNI